MEATINFLKRLKLVDIQQNVLGFGEVLEAEKWRRGRSSYLKIPQQNITQPEKSRPSC